MVVICYVKPWALALLLINKDLDRKGYNVYWYVAESISYLLCYYIHLCIQTVIPFL